MRIVLLGGAGFIGHHLAQKLRDSAEVIIVSRTLPREQDKVIGVTYWQGDCASSDFLREVILKDDYVVFLAYNSVPKTSFDDPLRDIEENLPLAINLLNVVRDIPISRLLYVSSGGTVYGHTEDTQPISEDHSTNPISPYGITKLAIEKYCQMYCQLFGVPLLIARPSNPYGPYQLPHRGQGFVATAAAKILQKEEIVIFGEHGTIRDYLYIDDLIDAMICLLKADVKFGSIYNIGSQIGINNLEVLSSIAKVLGIHFDEVKIKFLPSRHFDVPYNVLNNKKINQLGWHPKIAMNDGIAKTIDWLNRYLGAV